MKNKHLIILLIITLIFNQCSLLNLINREKTADCKVLMPEISGDYYGYCKNGLAHGEGKAEGYETYTGNFKKGYPHGEGVYKYKNGNKYKGDFKKGDRSGKGFLIKKSESGSDSIVKGVWKNDTLAQKAKKKEYQVLRTLNIDFYRFQKLGKGNEVNIDIKRILRSSRRVRNVQVSHSSGFLNQNGRQIRITEANYPLECRVYFLGPNITYKLLTEYEIKFVIKNKGRWDVDITY